MINPNEDTSKRPIYIPGSVEIKFKKGITLDRVQEIIGQTFTDPAITICITRSIIIADVPVNTEEGFIEKLKLFDEVKYAELSYIMYPAS